MTDYVDLQNLSKYIDPNCAYVVNMPGRHDWSLRNLSAMFSLVRFLYKRHYDILHLTWPPRYGAFPLYLLRHRMLLTMHDPLPHSSEDTNLNRFHRKIAMRLVPHFVLLNRFQRKDFIKKYCLHENQVFESRLGVYHYLNSIPPIFPDTQGYILFAGSISIHKGVDYLCQAMQTVHQRHPELKLIVAGKGHLYFNVGPYLKAGFLELQNRYLSDAELVGFIQNAKFVVCPYVDATQSGIIMSAFALSKPVIATNVGGLPEMVTDGRHGLIVPPKDADALASAIERLLISPDLIQQMRDNIRHDYDEASRSWRYIAEQLVNNVYSKLST